MALNWDIVILMKKSTDILNAIISWPRVKSHYCMKNWIVQESDYSDVMAGTTLAVPAWKTSEHQEHYKTEQHLQIPPWNNSNLSQ